MPERGSLVGSRAQPLNNPTSQLQLMPDDRISPQVLGRDIKGRRHSRVADDDAIAVQIAALLRWRRPGTAGVEQFGHQDARRILDPQVTVSPGGTTLSAGTITRSRFLATTEE